MVLVAQAFDLYGAPIFGAESSWTFDGDDMSGRGEVFLCSYAPSVLKSVRAEVGTAQSSSTMIHASHGHVEGDSPIGCAISAPSSSDSGLLLAPLFLLVSRLRRRRQALALTPGGRSGERWRVRCVRQCLVGLALVLAGCGQEASPGAGSDAGTDPVDAGDDAHTSLPDGSPDADADAGPPPPPRAFVGAEGFGALTRGAYAGSDTPEVLHVTHLNDGGQGSLRVALLTDAPRVIVFDVGGTIDLDSTIVVEALHHVTIAGQTAPGDGICIRGGALQFRRTHDIIIRGLRIRPGFATPNADGLNFRGSTSDADDAAENIIVDHCSISWGTDELLSTFFAVRNVTMQRNLLAEAITEDGGHNFGSLIGPGAERLSYHHNILAQNSYRNPLFGGGGDSGVMPHLQGATECESINNVVYGGGWGSFRIHENPDFVDGAQPQDIAVVGEYHKNGPSYSGDHNFIANPVDPTSQIYIHDCICPRRTSNAQDDWDVFRPESDPQLAARVDAWPFTPSGITVDDVFDNYDALLGMDGDVPRAGAYPRDPVDTRVVADIVAGTGEWITHEDEVGGYPVLDPGQVRPDGDRDGIPDEWESGHGLDPDDPADAHSDRNDDGYSNLEEYINSFFTPGG